MLWTRCRPRHPKKQARHDTLFMVPSCIVLSHSLVHVAEALLSWVKIPLVCYYSRCCSCLGV